MYPDGASFFDQRGVYVPAPVGAAIAAVLDDEDVARAAGRVAHAPVRAVRVEDEEVAGLAGAVEDLEVGEVPPAVGEAAAVWKNIR